MNRPKTPKLSKTDAIKSTAKPSTVNSKLILGFEEIAVALLKPHPRNYQSHPADQIKHLVSRIKDFGFYKNIVIARENTILAGHGAVLAAKEMGLATVTACRLNLDPSDPIALKLLVGDNEVMHLADRDDRALADLLREVSSVDMSGLDALLGTGYDDKMLANLLMVTRPKSEIKDRDEAAEWVGMPDFESGNLPLMINISFRNEKDRIDFLQHTKIQIGKKTSGRVWSTWWPYREVEDLETIRFTEGE